MILRNQIITDLEIHSVKDLYKLKPFLEDSTLKINKSQIARELEVDRRKKLVDRHSKYVDNSMDFKLFCERISTV